MANCNKHRENCGCNHPCPPQPCPPKPCPCHDDNCGGVFPKDFKLIEDVCELKRKLSEVFIRFDNDPSAYEKDDFRVLLRTLSLSLIHLYKESLTKKVCKDRTILDGEGCSNILYLVPKVEDDPSLSEDNLYDEYLYLKDGFELVGGSGVSFPEAPEDGNLYGRKDGDWAIIEEVAPYVFPGIVSDSANYLSVQQDEQTSVWHLGLTAAITDLPQAIVDEAAARVDADAALDDQISAVTDLLNTETENRINADDLLDERVTALENKVCNCAVFKEGFTTNITVGYLEAGTEIKIGDSIESVLKSILLGEPLPPVYDVTAVYPNASIIISDDQGNLYAIDNEVPYELSVGKNVTVSLVNIEYGHFAPEAGWESVNQPGNCATAASVFEQNGSRIGSKTWYTTESKTFQIKEGLQTLGGGLAWDDTTEAGRPHKSDGSVSDVKIEAGSFFFDAVFNGVVAKDVIPAQPEMNLVVSVDGEELDPSSTPEYENNVAIHIEAYQLANTGVFIPDGWEGEPLDAGCVVNPHLYVFDQEDNIVAHSDGYTLDANLSEGTYIVSGDFDYNASTVIPKKSDGTDSDKVIEACTGKPMSNNMTIVVSVKDVIAVMPVYGYTVLDAEGSSLSATSANQLNAGDQISVNFISYTDGYFKAVNNWGANQAAGCPNEGLVVSVQDASGAVIELATLASPGNSTTITVPTGVFTVGVMSHYGENTNTPVRSDGSASSVKIDENTHTVVYICNGNTPAADDVIYEGSYDARTSYDDISGDFITANLIEHAVSYNDEGKFIYTAALGGKAKDAVVIPTSLMAKTTLTHAEFGYEMEWSDTRNVTINNIDYTCMSYLNKADSNLSVIITITQ